MTTGLKTLSSYYIELITTFPSRPTFYDYASQMVSRRLSL